MKEAMSGKKVVHKAIHRKSTEANKENFKGMNNKARKAVSKAMRVTAEEVLDDLKNCRNLMF